MPHGTMTSYNVLLYETCVLPVLVSGRFTNQPPSNLPDGDQQATLVADNKRLDAECLEPTK